MSKKRLYVIYTVHLPSWDLLNNNSYEVLPRREEKEDVILNTLIKKQEHKM